jgi:hypothetical protein
MRVDQDDEEEEDYPMLLPGTGFLPIAIPPPATAFPPPKVNRLPAGYTLNGDFELVPTTTTGWEDILSAPKDDFGILSDIGFERAPHTIAEPTSKLSIAPSLGGWSEKELVDLYTVIDKIAAKKTSPFATRHKDYPLFDIRFTYHSKPNIHNPTRNVMVKDIIFKGSPNRTPEGRQKGGLFLRLSDVLQTDHITNRKDNLMFSMLTNDLEFGHKILIRESMLKKITEEIAPKMNIREYIRLLGIDPATKDHYYEDRHVGDTVRDELLKIVPAITKLVESTSLVRIIPMIIRDAIAPGTDSLSPYATLKHGMFDTVVLYKMAVDNLNVYYPELQSILEEKIFSSDVELKEFLNEKRMVITSAETRKRLKLVRELKSYPTNVAEPELKQLSVPRRYIRYIQTLLQELYLLRQKLLDKTPRAAFFI